MTINEMLKSGIKFDGKVVVCEFKEYEYAIPFRYAEHLFNRSVLYIYSKSDRLIIEVEKSSQRA